MTAPSTPGESRQRVSDETLAAICKRAEKDNAEGNATTMQWIALDLSAALAKAKARIAEVERERDEAREEQCKIANLCLKHICEKRDSDDRANAAEARTAIVREALEIIAGKRQCVDNLMSNVDVATAALALTPAGTSSCAAKDGEASA